MTCSSQTAQRAHDQWRNVGKVASQRYKETDEYLINILRTRDKVQAAAHTSLIRAIERNYDWQCKTVDN